MKTSLHWFMLLVMPVIMASCNSGGGPDSMSSQQHQAGNLPDCLACHSSEKSPSLDPLTTNGALTSGKHVIHVVNKGIACIKCHVTYTGKTTHMDGRMDTADPSVVMVSFDSSNPNGQWINDTGPQTGSCASINCHGTDTLNWYGTEEWVMPACSVCHTGPLDPLITNGEGTAGKHVKHVRDKGVVCEGCHNNYKNTNTHMNGVMDTIDPSINLTGFGAANPNGRWANDTGAQTGSCLSLNCHGGDTLDWYGTAGWTVPVACATCHTGPLDPLTTNGEGTAGKHIVHAGSKSFACGKCHQNYTNQKTHMNGVLDTPDHTVNMVGFDIVNQNGRWVNDTGPQTGECTSLNCHGASTLEWYGTGGWSFPVCSTCHASARGTRRQVLGAEGDFTKTSHHVISYADRTAEIVTDTDCRVCHDMDNHMSGAVRLKDKDNVGRVFLYQPGDPAGLETFCLRCHDTDGATTEAVPLTPFISTNTLGTVPNAAGARIKESWDKQYGHRRKGVTCMGTGAAGTGCHGNYNTATEAGSINAHGSGNAGLLANKLTLPITSEAWDVSRYKLCLDCHTTYPSVLSIPELAGVAEGGNYAQTRANYTQWPFVVDFMVTGFHDYYSYGMDRQYNLHLYHLIEGMGQWYYRGDTTESIPSCVTCHNVHGVDGRYYYLWDEWGFSIINDSGIEYGKFAVGNYAGTQYPDFCSANCHWGQNGNYRYPRSPFNEAKAVAADASNGGPGLQSGDTVTLRFSDSTNGAAITKANINTVLALSGGHTWNDSLNDNLTAVWSDENGKTNNVLTITLYVSGAPPANMIAVGDSIKFDSTTILDTTAAPKPVRGQMTLKGSF